MCLFAGLFEAMGFRVEQSGWNEERLVMRNWDLYAVVFDAGESWFQRGLVVADFGIPTRHTGGRLMVPLMEMLESAGYRFEQDGGIFRVESPTSNEGVMPTVEGGGACPFAIGRPSIRAWQGMPSDTQIAEWINTFVPTELELAVFNEINRVRAEYGLAAKSWDHDLAAMAALRTAYLVTEMDFLTLGPGGGHTAGSFTTLDVHGVVPRDVTGRGAILSRRTYTPGVTTVQQMAETAVAGWLNSPGHRAQVLAPDGFLVGVGASGHQWWVHYDEGFAGVVVYAFNGFLER